MVLQTRHAWKCAVLLEREEKKYKILKKKILAEDEDAQKKGKHLSNMLY